MMDMMADNLISDKGLVRILDPHLKRKVKFETRCLSKETFEERYTHAAQILRVKGVA